ncbi:hypothetical protein WG82_06170 [Citrobacter amalonaticus]|nr:hypothetical protein WG82_06170 [Citrobacter amalonaticus]OCF81204.1 hypothetical protein AS299_07045 [Citrobacter freundii]
MPALKLLNDFRVVQHRIEWLIQRSGKTTVLSAKREIDRGKYGRIQRHPECATRAKRYTLSPQDAPLFDKSFNMRHAGKLCGAQQHARRSHPLSVAKQRQQLAVRTAKINRLREAAVQPPFAIGKSIKTRAG